MNVTLTLVGISFGQFGDRMRNWKITKDVFTHNVIRPIQNIMKNTVKTVIVTNENDSVPELISFYSPEKYLILSKSEMPTQKHTFMEGLKLLRTVDTEFIFITRFDVIFFDKFNTMNFDFEKFNILFKEGGVAMDGTHWWEKHRYVNDILFAFPKKYLEDFIKAVQEMIDNPYLPVAADTFNNNLHSTYRNILPYIGEENIHFVYETPNSSNSNEIYSLMR